MNGFPTQTFLTLNELAKRWNKDKEYINYLIETKLIAIGDKHAALNGRRYTVFKGIDPSDYDNNIENLRQNANEEIVIVRINDNQVPYWDSMIQKVRDEIPDSQIPVILMSDIVEFEQKYSVHNELKRISMTKIQHRCEMILEKISELGYEKFSIPERGKSSIKELCLKNPQLFTADTFKKAWQAGLDDNLFRMAKHDLYSNK